MLSWEGILKSAQRLQLDRPKTVLFIGDRKADLKSLVSTFCNDDVDGSLQVEPLSFTYFCELDEEGEIASKIKVYSLLNDPAYFHLLDCVVKPEELQDLFIVVVLDWARPMKMLIELKTVLDTLALFVESMDADIFRYCRDNVDDAIRNYSEYDSVKRDQLNQKIELGLGVLTQNLGIPLVFALVKSDSISKLEKSVDEEALDFVQQCVRTIAIQYGASVFSLSLLRPETISNLRAYTLYRLFKTQNHSLLKYEFNVPTQAVEREVLLLPSGWDSVGKIKLVNANFPVEIYLDAAQTNGAIPPEMITDFDSLIKTPTMDQIMIPELQMPEDEQVFLERLSTVLQTNDTITEPPKSPSIPTEISSPAKTTPAAAPSSDDVSLKIAKLLEQSNSMREKYKTETNRKFTSDRPTDTSQSEMLNSFFQSLLTKKQGSK